MFYGCMLSTQATISRKYSLASIMCINVSVFVVLKIYVFYPKSKLIKSASSFLSVGEPRHIFFVFFTNKYIGNHFLGRILIMHAWKNHLNENQLVLSLEVWLFSRFNCSIRWTHSSKCFSNDQNFLPMSIVVQQSFVQILFLFFCFDQFSILFLHFGRLQCIVAKSNG